jgi:hypothetical protein
MKERSKSITPVSSSSKQFSTADQKKISQINTMYDPTDAIENRIASNISELTKSSTTNIQQSKTSNLPSDNREDYDRVPIRSRMKNRDTSLTNKQRIDTPSSSSKYEQKSTYNPLSEKPTSAPSQSTNISKRRSQSATSKISSTASIDQSQQLIKNSLPSMKSNQISYTQKPSTIDSHLSQLRQTSTANNLPIDSTLISTKENNSQRPQVNITDSTFNEYHLQPNTQNISS